MSVKVIDRGWNRIKKELDDIDNAYVNVGVLSDAGQYAQFSSLKKSQGKFVKGRTHTSTANLADVATFNEFGTSDIPARPFMGQTFENNRDIVGASIAVMKDQIFLGETSVTRALNKLGTWYKGLIQKIFKEGEFQENAPATIRIKKSSKPLIDTGRLRQSIDYEVVKE